MSDIPYTITATQVAGGYDVEISATDGHRIFPQAEISADGTRCTLHVRDYAAPRIGQRVCVHRMLVKVADVRFDQSGRLMVMDEDTRAWLPLEG